MDFINPPPFGTIGDFSQNLVFKEGSTVNVIWTPGDPEALSSLGLFQVNGTAYVEDFEYITHKVLDSTRFNWIVATTKDLEFSNVFILCIFEEGKSRSDANSHYFNITAKDNSPLSSSSEIFTSTSSAASSSTSTVSTTSSTSSTITTSSAAVTSETADSSSPNLSTGASIGLGVGITCAALLLLAVSWFLYKRHKRQSAPIDHSFAQNNIHGVSQSVPSYMTQPDSWKYQSPALYELNNNEPSNMAHRGDSSVISELPNTR